MPGQYFIERAQAQAKTELETYIKEISNKDF